MHRSELTIDLGAVRRNARTLLRALDGAELWAVVKADGYGHGAATVAGAALDAGATALGVATTAEALALRQGVDGLAQDLLSSQHAVALPLGDEPVQPWKRLPERVPGRRESDPAVGLGGERDRCAQQVLPGAKRRRELETGDQDADDHRIRTYVRIHGWSRQR